MFSDDPTPSSSQARKVCMHFRGSTLRRSDSQRIVLAWQGRGMGWVIRSECHLVNVKKEGTAGPG